LLDYDSSLSGCRQGVLVGADAGCLEGFRAQLFVLIGNHVHAEREFVDIGTLASEIEDADLRVGYTTVETRLRVWLRTNQ
jgi:hypothetical protein